jgi:hypothetical protein
MQPPADAITVFEKEEVMTKWLGSALVFGLACLIAVGSALAQEKEKKGERPRDPEAAFKKLDTNGDGKLTLEEWKKSPLGSKDETKAEAMFKKMDADSDGSVTLEEYKKFAERMGGGKKGGKKGGGGT